MENDALNFHAIVGPNGMCMCGVKADGTVVTCGALLKAELKRRTAEYLDLIKEASEIMTITYAGNFPAGIESFLIRAARAGLP